MSQDVSSPRLCVAFHCFSMLFSSQSSLKNYTFMFNPKRLCLRTMRFFMCHVEEGLASTFSDAMIKLFFDFRSLSFRRLQACVRKQPVHRVPDACNQEEPCRPSNMAENC